MTKKSTPKKEYREEVFVPSELENKQVNFKINPLKFKSQKQKDFFDLCRNEDIKLLICDGPAGTGKGYLSIYAALKQLKAGKYEKIMYLRSPVGSSNKDIGFLPGTMEEKIINYMHPLDEKLSKFIEFHDIKKLYEHDKIEYAINTFIRGRSIENTIIIVDEIQNLDLDECKSLFSRTEETTKIVAIGDHMQSDIGLNSSLSKLMMMFGGDDKDVVESMENGVATFKFNNEDIVRSKLTRFIVEKFDKYNKISRRN